MQFNLSKESIEIILEALNLELKELNKTLATVSGIEPFEKTVKDKISDVEYLRDTFKEAK